MIVIGLGTGRCGTMSLARLLNAQDGVWCTHEYLVEPAGFDGLDWRREDQVATRLKTELDNGFKVVGDVAYYHLSYVRFWKSVGPCRFICMRRDRDEYIQSAIRKIGNHNIWMAHDGTKWNHCGLDDYFPKFPGPTREEAIGQFWDWYYMLAERMEDENFRIFNMTDLNTEQGVLDILEFARVPEPNPIVGLRCNATT